MDANIFTSLLNVLGVKHTQTFSNRFYNEHPHKYNLFGLSKMLSDYGIANAGTRIEDKFNDILNIQTPFVAHVGGDFAAVVNVTEKDVEYKSGNLNLNISRKAFCDIWSGVVMLTEADSNSIEPDYEKHRNEEVTQRTLNTSLILAISLLLIFGLYNNYHNYGVGLILSFLINIIGAYIGVLLVQKQLKIHSSYSDKICSLFKQADCNSILESQGAKLWGKFGWSEIGLSYFLSNLIVIAFLPNLINYYAIINLFTLPYAFWSIWYQQSKAKQWCVLCLIVQIALWLIFLINLSFQYLQTPEIELSNVIVLVALYATFFITTTIITPYLAEQLKRQNVTQEINSLKSHEGITSLLLEEQPYYACDKSDSKILFGNPNSEILITILTNPHCNPCAKLHTRIEKLLASGQQNICIQYIFSSFDQSLDISNKFLIAAYLNSSPAETSLIFNQWYARGRMNKEHFFKKFSFDVEDDRVQSEFQNHLNWKFHTKLELTPTLLVNGHKLPRNYQIEDFKFISELKINKKREAAGRTLNSVAQN
ncbi:vitamin K epoxide reductase family protein [Parapedobacter indicus]|uniref:Thioredoxin n=1 Tax=Parapedobacter indicus TaxID=1477437 RepID=A0A1I3HSJ6_9SPHI|nr:vitamin K epoxide reductase family protein [Parapedobacter indicus]PPL03149.1 thioredoxin-like protein [Parapedobacter indicus]SFI38631.1 Thioredoxin [Parapedobacter indicus]